MKGKALELYGTDLTKRAGEGKLDPVIGREEEIRRTIQGTHASFIWTNFVSVWSLLH